MTFEIEKGVLAPTQPTANKNSDERSEEVQVAKVITIIIFGVTITITVFVSLSATSMGSSQSSKNSVWALFNQLQLMLFLVMMDTYIHPDIIEYILKFTFALFNMNFFSFDSLPGITVPADWPDFDQPFKKLKAIDIKSRSSFTN